MFAFYCTSNLDYIYIALTKGENKMKIEDNRNDTRKFSELVIGDVFTCENGCYIKTMEMRDVRGDISYFSGNAIALGDKMSGSLCNFEDDRKVELIDDVTLVLN